jgi:hypothetical protein
MSAESADPDDSPTDDRFKAELVAVLRGLGGEVEPWKRRSPATDIAAATVSHSGLFAKFTNASSLAAASSVTEDP